MLELTGRHGVAREQEAPRQDRAESVEEEVQVAERGAEQSRTGHPELRVAAHHRDVRHQGQLERAAERVRLDLGDRDLREGEVVVVEAEALPVDAEAPALAGPPTRVVGAVPRVRVLHVGAGAEHTVRAAQDHHLDVVVGRELFEVRAHRATHRRVVGVPSIRIVDRDPGDVGLRVSLDVYRVTRSVRRSVCSSMGS